jgi:hypothetical protein
MAQSESAQAETLKWRDWTNGAAQSGISHHGPRRCLSAKERASEIYGMHSVEILGEHIDKPLHDRDARAVS